MCRKILTQKLYTFSYMYLVYTMSSEVKIHIQEDLHVCGGVHKHFTVPCENNIVDYSNTRIQVLRYSLSRHKANES